MEIKASVFLWGCRESLCFGSWIFIHPNTMATSPADPAEPLSSLCHQLSVSFWALAQYPLEQSLAENHLLPVVSQHPTLSTVGCGWGSELGCVLQLPWGSGRGRAPAWRQICVWGGLVGSASRQLSVWFSNVCKSRASLCSTSQPHFNLSTNHTTQAARRDRAVKAAQNNHPLQLSSLRFHLLRRWA